jgi:DNA/RNA endonuclease G (NUC1)
MPLFVRRSFRPLALAVVILSCRGDRLAGPASQPVAPSLDVSGPASGLVISEFIADPSGTDTNGEWFEVYNVGPDPVDLKDYRIASGPGIVTLTPPRTATDTHTVRTSVVVPAGGYVVLGNNANSATNGGIVLDYAYPATGSGSITLNNSNTDWLTLKAPDGTLMDSVAYSVSTIDFTRNPPLPPLRTITSPSFTPTSAASRALLDLGADNTIAADPQYWADAVSPYGSKASKGTPGQPNVGGEVVKVAVRVSWVTPGTSFKITASATDVDGKPSPTNFTWSTNDPMLATIDQVTGLATGGVHTGVAFVTATAANGVQGTSPLFVVNPGDVASVSLSMNEPHHMPAGYTKPIFPTVRTTTSSNVTDETTLTWSSSNEAIATVDSRGYVTAIAPGPSDSPTTTITATAPNGVYSTLDVSVISATAPTSAIYRNHVEFGTPKDATPDDEVILIKPQYVLSYNKDRGGPNWVSWNLNKTHFGSIDRCDCFSADPALPAESRIVDFDYRNSGYDRGHMVQSASRGTTEQENAATFLLTNILPQGAENNQGPWAQFEVYLNDSLAKPLDKEIYVIAGGEFAATPPTLKGEGKVAIPDYTWKVAVIMDGDKGLADVHSVSDLQVVAVRMPNLTTPDVPASSIGIRNIKWRTYLTTVDEIEEKTGYDLLDGIPDPVERVVEHDGLVATFTVSPTIPAEGGLVQFDGGESGDPQGDALTYTWDFGDGTEKASGGTAGHTYHDDGTFTVTLTVKDPAGGTSTTSKSVTVTNVNPVASWTSPAPVIEGDRFTLSLGNAYDPSDADLATLTYAFDCGDGEGLSIASASSSRICTPTDDGDRTVRARVIDDEGGFTEYSGTVSVANVAPVAVWTVPTPVTEGQSFTLPLTSAFDPSATDLAQLRYAFDCGDGRGLVDVGTSTSLVCTTSDNASRAVQARVSDKDGGATAYVGTVPVLNAAPVITGFETPRGPVRTGSEVSLRLAYTDAGSADTHELVVDWGDGTTSMRIAGGSAEARHIYSAAGLYTISALVRDDDGGVASRSAAGYLVVYNPAAGFVTGGGWFASGRETAPRSGGNGKVTVGFVARYGGDAAAGSLELQAHDQGLDFHGDAVEWLVVSGDRSTFKGTGTVRGRAGTYGFLVTAIDGDVAARGADQLRVKIWDASDRVIFDNRPAAADGSDAATPLGGGSVVLHER